MIKNKHAILLAILFLILIFFIIFLETNSEIVPANNRDYLPLLVREINAAENSVHVSMFSLTYYDSYAGSSANQILEALADAKSRGVDVKVVIDEFPADMEPGIEFIQQSGIPLKFDGKKQTTHTKLIIIDSEEFFIGSTNWRYYSIDKNNEANVLIKSKSLAEEYELYFNEIWENGQSL